MSGFSEKNKHYYAGNDFMVIVGIGILQIWNKRLFRIEGEKEIEVNRDFRASVRKFFLADSEFLASLKHPL